MPERLVLGPGSRIGHLNVCRGITLLELGPSATLGRGNVITGTPKSNARHYRDHPDRNPELVLGPHAALTNGHHIDCTDSVIIGGFATVAGHGSQVWTHGFDLLESKQSAAPVRIGAYTMVGTRCVLIKGSELPDCSVLAAGAVLTTAMTDPYYMYGGTPARPLRPMPREARYFTRVTGSVD
jgi:acetyltransferase-like isoleucine patch superfamily enzyme